MSSDRSIMVGTTLRSISAQLKTPNASSSGAVPRDSGSRKALYTLPNAMARKKTGSRGPQTAKTIYVFGSDLAGKHTRGTALIALREYGAVYGEAVGLRGRSYALPVRDEQGALLPLTIIKRYVQAFLRFAGNHRDLTFYVTRIGCEPGAYSERDIAPLFAQAPPNCRLPRKWRSA